jgi:hypothetical protein
MANDGCEADARATEELFIRNSPHSNGIEKIIPKNEHLAVFIRLLTRSATGMPITDCLDWAEAISRGSSTHSG